MSALSTSPLPVFREDVVFVLDDGVARQPALGVVPLRRHGRRRGGRERVEAASYRNAAQPQPPLSANRLSAGDV